MKHVHDLGAHHTQSLALTCRRLASIVRSVGPYGDTALPVHLSRRVRRDAARGVEVTPSGNGRELVIRKTSTAGDGYVLFDRCIAGTSSYWQFRIERLRGNRIDVGVATPHAFRFATVERRSSWSFDCFGRVSLAGERRAYGRQMRKGDMVGVLYDAGRRSLLFLDNGVCMGEVELEGVGDGKVHLLPFVYVPYHEGEAVTLVEGGGPVDVRAVREGAQRWRRPVGLSFEGCVIVQTWEPRLWYAIPVREVRTVAGLWREVARRHGMSAELFELIYEGRRLPMVHGVRLEEVGIAIDARTGTNRADVLLSVPHIVS